MGKAIGGHSQGPALTAGPHERAGGGRSAATRGDEVFALGGWLAKQRRLRGIRLEELAALTRLPVRSLERLEAGAFDGQQDGFVRGFVRTVAVAIGLDPEDAVARLLAEPELRSEGRLPELRALALAGLGLVVALALGVAVWQLARALGSEKSEGPPLVRRDAVRALAVEEGLLSEQPEAPGAPAALLLEPAPLEATPAAEPEAAAAGDPAPEAPLGVAAPAAPAPPD
jgi:hypothetical protein